MEENKNNVVEVTEVEEVAHPKLAKIKSGIKKHGRKAAAVAVAGVAFVAGYVVKGKMDDRDYDNVIEFTELDSDDDNVTE